MGDNQSKPVGRPVATNPKAVSARPGTTAFLTPPEGSPVYYGFAVLEEVVAEGFTMGKITDFEAKPTDVGDGFVIAPDGSRCGLVWEVSRESYFQQVCPHEPGRWGVWGVSFPHPMNSRENARRNLEFILPNLKAEWRRWRERFDGASLTPPQ